MAQPNLTIIYGSQRRAFVLLTYSVLRKRNQLHA